MASLHVIGRLTARAHVSFLRELMYRSKVVDSMRVESGLRVRSFRSHSGWTKVELMIGDIDLRDVIFVLIIGLV